METRVNILQELEQISHEVATIGNSNVYTVPEGYFDTLTDYALIKVQMAALQAMPMPFSVPQEYFTTLAGNVMAKIKGEGAGTGDKDNTAGLAIGSPGYTVPEGYFNNLAGSVMAKIKALEVQKNSTGADIETDFLKGVGMPYSAPPASYFNNLAGNVMAKIKAGETVHAGNEVFEELAAIAPLLNNIGKAMPYTVPAGYFEQLDIKAPVEEKQEAKIISIKTGRSQKWYTYAVAACIAVLLGIGGYMFVPSRGDGEINPKTVDIKKALAGLSSDDINSYLDSQPSISPEAAPTSIEDQVPDVQTEIENTSTQEIQQYLKENSDPGENRGKPI
ncbi:MAG TPA: hypothetical protein VG738_02350 [Chitinophagaceae bacterium]|nr:hypothetical protein [Chitinophagaceae bacterium]